MISLGLLQPLQFSDCHFLDYHGMVFYTQQEW